MSRQQTQRVAGILLTIAAAIAIIPILIVITFLLVNGLQAISWEFLTLPPSNGMTEGGIMPAILGTIVLTMGTAIASIPLAVGAAIYLAEYAGDTRFTRAIRLAIVNLAGIPSIVYGLFGLGVFVLFLEFGTSILAGSLTLPDDTPCRYQHLGRGDFGCSTRIPSCKPEPGGHPMANNP
jgi:phosphate transport system permease protein